MARWVPFTAHIRIVPNHGSGLRKSKKFENWRDMQKIASYMYEALSQNTSLNLATPGGGQQLSQSTSSGFGGMSAGLAVKPQIGEVPAQTMITGFYNAGANNTQPHPDKQLIHAGETLDGPGSSPCLTGPVSTIDSGVKNLKTTIETELSTLPPDIIYSIFRIEYSGVTYGDKGYHFPL
jgi:hypothetical protein